MMKVVVWGVLFWSAAAAQDPAEDLSTESIIERLRKDAGDVGELSRLVKRSDPRIVPALKEAFLQAKLTDALYDVGRHKMHATQRIAALLIELGIKDDLYFDELAKYARAAIAEDPPDPFLMIDAEGNVDTSRPSLAFDKWCASRNLESDVCKDRLLDYAMDVGQLASAHDRRAIAIFREGLKGSGQPTVFSAVVGLVNLNDVDSVPLIAKACSRFPARGASAFGAYAVHFESAAAAEIVFQSCIADPQEREQMKKQWGEKHKQPAAADAKERRRE